jgi:hypothetical protein
MIILKLYIFIFKYVKRMADLIPVYNVTGGSTSPIYSNSPIYSEYPQNIEHKSSSLPFIIIGLVSLAIIIGYVIFLVIMNSRKGWIFSAYKPPKLTNGLQPGGEVVKQSTDAVSAKLTAICNSYVLYNLKKPSVCP